MPGGYIERISDIYEGGAFQDGERDVASFEGMQVRINTYQYQCAKVSAPCDT